MQWLFREVLFDLICEDVAVVEVDDIQEIDHPLLRSLHVKRPQFCLFPLAMQPADPVEGVSPLVRIPQQLFA